MEPTSVKIVACFVIVAVIGTEAMNYMAFPRLGRSPRSAIEKLNGRYNGQAFAFPRGRRALGSDVAVDTSLRTKTSLNRQQFNHHTNQLKTPLFKTKSQSRIKRSLFHNNYVLAHRFGHYPKHPPNDKVITPHPEAHYAAKRAIRFPMPRSSNSAGVDQTVSNQGPQGQSNDSKQTEKPTYEDFNSHNNDNDDKHRSRTDDHISRRYSMPRSSRNSAEILTEFPMLDFGSTNDAMKTPRALAEYLLIHRRKYPMPRSDVSKRNSRSHSTPYSSLFKEWWNTARQLNIFSKNFLSHRPKPVQRSVFIMPKRTNDQHTQTRSKRSGYPMPRSFKRTGFYPMPRSSKRTGFYPMPRSSKRTGFYPMPRSAKRTGFYPMPRKRTDEYQQQNLPVKSKRSFVGQTSKDPINAKRSGFYPMPRSAKRTGFYPMPRSAKRTGFYPMPRSAKRTGFYPMPRSAKRTGFYPMPRSAKRTGFYPMPRSAKRTGFYPMPRSAKRTGFYPMPRSAKRTGFYPIPRSEKRTGFFPMPRNAKRTGFYPMPRSVKRTGFYPMPRKRTDEYQQQNLLVMSKRSGKFDFSFVGQTSKDPINASKHNQKRQISKRSVENQYPSDASGDYLMSRDTSSSGYYPMPRDATSSGYYPMPRDVTNSGYYHMPRDTSTGYYPMPRDTSTGYYPMPRDTSTGYYPMPRDASTGYYPMSRDATNSDYEDAQISGHYPILREDADDVGLTSNMTDEKDAFINNSNLLTSLDVIALLNILKNGDVERNDEERSVSKVYDWLDELKQECPEDYTKCSTLLNGIRGYLAFPRLGRSNSQTLQSSEFEAECCPEGIKSHWIVIGASKPEIQSRCSPKSVCCEGLEELVGRSSEHIFYTKCVPKISDEKSENTVLDRLLRKS